MNPEIASLIVSTVVSAVKLVGSIAVKEEIKIKYLALKDLIAEKLGLKKNIERIEKIVEQGEELKESRIEDLEDDIQEAIKEFVNNQTTESEKEAFAEEIIAKTKALGNALTQVKEADIDVSNINALGNITVKDIINPGTIKVKDISSKQGSVEISNIGRGQGEVDPTKK